MTLVFAQPFLLVRDVDVTGVSGEGIVADGVLWPDGTVSVRWRGDQPSVVFWDNGMEAVAEIHGHDGKTRAVFEHDDSDTAMALPGARLTGRGFALYADFLDTYGKAGSVQESSAAERRCVWVGAGEERLHLDEDGAAIVVNALSQFLRDYRPPAAEPAGDSPV